MFYAALSLCRSCLLMLFNSFLVRFVSCVKFRNLHRLIDNLIVQKALCVFCYYFWLCLTRILYQSFSRFPERPPKVEPLDNAKVRFLQLM